MLNLLLFVLLGQVATVQPDTIDVIIEKVQKLRTQRADLLKQEEDLIGQAKTRFADLAKKLEALGAAPTPAPPPAPTDKLAADLAQLYAAEASAAKKVQTLTLANLYRQAAKEANSPSYETCAELASMILSFIEVADGLGAEALKGVRVRVLAELKTKAPNLAAPLNDQLRQDIGAIYSRAAAILEGVAK